MAKRRVQESSDEEEESSQTSTYSNKRSKTDHVKEPHANGDENSDTETQPMEIDDEKFEEENAEAIIRDLKEKRKVQGGIAESGIIESIEMHQFMCHKYLTFQFGPQINFIIGHNGSGKSAVLSAITVALGGKATSTGRGSGLKSFIREGQSISEVTITLKNQGEEAYKPEEYGRRIIITRRFTREGSSTWKIMDQDRKLVSNKRADLAAICDHMNIQVDNPLNILTQDSARQFLSASHPSDKYKFFLRGTQLQQLSDEYDQILDNIQATYKFIEQKRLALPELKQAFKEAKVRFEEANKALEQKKKLDDLRRELAWSHVAEKQKEWESKAKDVVKAERRIDKQREALAEAKARFDSATEEVAAREAEVRELGDVSELKDCKHKLSEQIRKNRDKIMEYNNEGRTMQTTKRGYEKSITEYEQRIAAEMERMEANNQGKRERLERDLQKNKETFENAKNEVRELHDQRKQKQDEAEKAERRGREIEREESQARTEIEREKETMRKLQQEKNNTLAQFGSRIQEVLNAIKMMHWHGDVPMGPLGMYVTLKDHTWAEVIRTVIGPQLCSFAITDMRDHKQLKDLLTKFGNSQASIVTSDKDLFDYSSGEPPENYLTILRALEFSDPHVLRILINTAKIEKTMLFHSRAEADKMLRQLPTGGIALVPKPPMRVTVFAEGGGSTIAIRPVNDFRKFIFERQDRESLLRQCQASLKKAEEAHESAHTMVQTLRATVTSCKREANDLERRAKIAWDKQRKAQLEIDRLQDEINNDQPVEIESLEDAKREAENEIKNLMEQFAEHARRKLEVDQENAALLKEQGKIRDKITEFDTVRGEAVAAVEQAVAKRVKAQSDCKSWEAKIETAEEEIQTVRGAADHLEKEYGSWREKALEFCDPVENPRPKQELQRAIDAVEGALKERKRRGGKTVEELAEELNKAQADKVNLERDIDTHTKMNKSLKAALEIRLNKWQAFRRHIALRCKHIFAYQLSHRGYFGKILFDHENQTLQLKVQTEENATQARDKDTRALSGGEKSFSTICLLLSLWESIGCPLRCLDEFDVFMDAVNRRISMKMMMETANASDKKQYILITPQDLNNVKITPSVKVHRMGDPNRSRGAFAS